MEKPKRYFYSRRFAAAWMWANFGMKFTGVGARPGTDAETVCDWDYVLSNTIGKAYIAPASTHLLEPRIGDLVFDDMNENGVRVMVSDHPTRHVNAPVIMRKGIPFMWPQSE